MLDGFDEETIAKCKDLLQCMLGCWLDVACFIVGIVVVSAVDLNVALPLRSLDCLFHSC